MAYGDDGTIGGMYQTPQGPTMLPHDTAQALGLQPVDNGAPAAPDASQDAGSANAIVAAPPTNAGMEPVAPALVNPFAGTAMGIANPYAPSGAAAGAPVAPDQANANPSQATAGVGGTPLPTASAPPVVSAKDLRTDPYSGVLNEQNAALAQADAAGKASAQAQSAAAEQKARAFATEQSNQDAIAKKRADEDNQRMTMINQKQADVDAALAKVQSTKIDRTVDHPILAAISVALAGLGGVMQKDGMHNPALDMLMKVIDRKVQGQVDDRANAVQNIQAQKGQIDSLRQSLTDRHAYYDGLAAANIATTKNMVEQIAARSTSAEVKANAQKLSSDLALKAAEYRESAIDKQSAQDWEAKKFSEQVRASKASEGVAYGHLALAKQDLELRKDQFVYGQQKDKEAMDLEAAKIGLSGKAGKAAQVQELGVGGVPTVQNDDKGNAIGVAYKPLANSDGEVFTAPTKEEAVALRKQKAGVDTANMLINSMVDGIDKYGGSDKYTQSAEFQKVLANKEALLFALHAAYGVEGFRPGVLEQMEKALGGGDPTSYLRSAAPGLKAARDALNQHFTQNLRAANYTGADYAPTDTTKFSTTPDDVHSAYEAVAAQRTPQDEAAGAKVGTIRKGLDYATGAGLFYNTADERATAIENHGSTKYGGFSEDQGKNVGMMFDAYHQGGAKAEEAKKSLLNMVAKGDDSMRAATLSALKDNAPELYKTAVDKLPDKERKYIEQTAPLADARRATLAELAPAMRSTDPNVAKAAREEVFRRSNSTDKKTADAALKLATDYIASVKK